MKRTTYIYERNDMNNYCNSYEANNFRTKLFQPLLITDLLLIIYIKV